MKTTFKIVRSIATSLLFLILTVVLIIQFGFTALKIDASNLPNLIDREALLERTLDKIPEDPEMKDVALTFLDDYINYIFHKRSFPSIQTVDFSKVSEENLKEAKSMITTLNDNIELEYDTVITLRDADGILSNGAIYLLINIGLFLIFIVLVIEQMSFKKGTKLLSISLIVSSIFALIGLNILPGKMESLVPRELYNFLSVSIDAEFIRKSVDLAVTYFTIGLITFAIIYAYDRFFAKKDI